MVRMRGLEPPRCHHHRLLRPARLPVPPHPRTEKLSRCGCSSVKQRFGTAESQSEKSTPPLSVCLNRRLKSTLLYDASSWPSAETPTLSNSFLPQHLKSI